MLNKIKHSEHHLVAKIWKYKKCSYRSLWNPALNYLFNIRHNVLDNMVPYTFSFKLIIKFFFMSYHLWWMIYCWIKCKISLGVSFKCLLFEKEFSASFWGEKFEPFRNMLKDTKIEENWKGGSSLFFVNLLLNVKENSDGIRIRIRSAAHKIELHANTMTTVTTSAARLILVCFVLTVKKLL